MNNLRGPVTMERSRKYGWTTGTVKAVLTEKEYQHYTSANCVCQVVVALI